jgi:hypothetical protein
MRFARIVFLIAGIYGMIVMAPQYFLESTIARQTGPITHPEYFYGFLGLCIAWQVLFLAIARDPVRLRPAMPVAMLEKVSFPLPVFVLYAQGRVNAQVAGFASVDVLLLVLFTIAYLRTPSQVAV